MRILIDTGHPVHIHFFAPIAHRLIQSGHEVLFSIREKDCSLSIIKSYNLPFKTKGRGSYSIFFKPFYFLSALKTIYFISKDFKPDLFLSFASPYASVVASVLNKSHIVFDDTEGDPLVQTVNKSLATKIVTPVSFQQKLGEKQLFINAFKEQAYLKDYTFSPEAGNYILVRLVNHGAMHDLFSKVWHEQDRFDFIRELAQKYSMVISSEIPLPVDLKPFEYSRSPEDLHAVMSRAKMVIGESATVSMEAAVLGVPAVYIDYNTRGYIETLEREYGLVEHFLPVDHELEKAKDSIREIMENPVDPHYQEQRKKLFRETDDIVEYMLNLIEKTNYLMP